MFLFFSGNILCLDVAQGVAFLTNFRIICNHNKKYTVALPVNIYNLYIMIFVEYSRLSLITFSSN